MPDDQLRLVEIAQTVTPFEAETIAAALRDQGVEARVMVSNAAYAGLTNLNSARVMVRQDQIIQAQAALAVIQERGSSIDWDSVDVGDDREAMRTMQMARSRRWTWTLVVLAIPVALFVLFFGVARADPILQTLGGTLVMVAMAMGIAMLMAERENSGQSPGTPDDPA